MPSLIQQLRDCLQTETKAMLRAESPEKGVLVAVQSYSLLLLNKGSDECRTEEIVASIRCEVGIPVTEYPFVIAQHLTLDDAYAFQLAMCCCDCVTAFVSDDVVDEAPIQTFRKMLLQVGQSPEFEMVDVCVEKVPQTEEGHQFNWMFFGVATGLRTPTTYRMFRKKARLLGIWARRISAEVKAIDE